VIRIIAPLLVAAARRAYTGLLLSAPCFPGSPQRPRSGRHR